MTIQDVLKQQTIELPSWAFGNSGTRFKVFAQQGVPRDPYEKIADAAKVNEFTALAPNELLVVNGCRAGHRIAFGGLGRFCHELP